MKTSKYTIITNNLTMSCCSNYGVWVSMVLSGNGFNLICAIDFITLLFLTHLPHIFKLNEFPKEVSVLGPLLFLIYINALTDGIRFSLLSLFADDTKIMKPIISPTCQQELQHDLNYLSSWCSEWKLKLNLSKCAAMCVTISSRSRIAPASYNIQHQQISSTNKQKDLGVPFTSNLSWLDHFNIICSKA